MVIILSRLVNKKYLAGHKRYRSAFYYKLLRLIENLIAKSMAAPIIFIDKIVTPFNSERHRRIGWKIKEKLLELQFQKSFSLRCQLLRASSQFKMFPSISLLKLVKTSQIF